MPEGGMSLMNDVRAWLNRPFTGWHLAIPSNRFRQPTPIAGTPSVPLRLHCLRAAQCIPLRIYSQPR